MNFPGERPRRYSVSNGAPVEHFNGKMWKAVRPKVTPEFERVKLALEVKCFCNNKHCAVAQCFELIMFHHSFPPPGGGKRHGDESWNRHELLPPSGPVLQRLFCKGPTAQRTKEKPHLLAPLHLNHLQDLFAKWQTHTARKTSAKVSSKKYRPLTKESTSGPRILRPTLWPSGPRRSIQCGSGCPSGNLFCSWLPQQPTWTKNICPPTNIGKIPSAPVKMDWRNI